MRRAEGQASHHGVTIVLSSQSCLRTLEFALIQGRAWGLVHGESSLQTIGLPTGVCGRKTLLMADVL